MPNWTTNYAVINGTPEVIADIMTAMNIQEQYFDFDVLRPTPRQLKLLNSPIRVMDDQKFLAQFGFLPTDITTMIHDYTTHAPIDPASVAKPDAYSYVPRTLHKQLINTYNADNWCDWCNTHWGTKWAGLELQLHYTTPTTIVCTFDTPWCSPDVFFEYLCDKYSTSISIHTASIDEDVRNDQSDIYYFDSDNNDPIFDFFEVNTYSYDNEDDDDESMTYITITYKN